MRTTIRRFATIDSTNSEAIRQAMAGAPEGLCIVADEQTRGRGRQQRVWVSPPRAGLYMSLLLRPRLPLESWPLLTLMSATAVVEALDKFGLAGKTDIKWPNDIYADERKLGGILAETTETDAGRAAILGIGINLTDDALPPDLRPNAISLAALTGQNYDALMVLECILSSLEIHYARLEGGERDTLQSWAARSSYAEGKPVRVTFADETLEGITRGLEPDGALRIEVAGGEIKTIRAGDVTALRKK